MMETLIESMASDGLFHPQNPPRVGKETVYSRK